MAGRGAGAGGTWWLCSCWVTKSAPGCLALLPALADADLCKGYCARVNEDRLNCG